MLSQTRILFVEDDERINRLLQRYFSDRRCTILGLSDTNEIWDTIESFGPHILLLDWSLPGRSGLEILRDLRRHARFADLPVIMLTARDEEIDRVEGLQTGADDYVVKPFALAELEARIQSVLRRAQRKAPAYRDEHIEIDPGTRVLRIRGKVQTLSLYEWSVLEILLNSSTIVDRSELLKRVWGHNPPSSPRSIDNIIMRLRRIIEPTETPRYIVTERGSGYRFIRH